MPCAVCGGRVIKSEQGKKCMNPSCEGAHSSSTGEQTVECSCGKTMTYQNMTQWGEPVYKCMDCGRTKKL